jgi:hypothetical protein
MSGLTAANFNSLYNNPTGGSFPTNTSQEIGSNDLRQFAEDIKDSFFNLTDSAFTGAKGINSTPFNLTEFRAIPTIGVSERVIVPWLNLYNDGENLSIYQLRNDTVADDGYNYIRPDDYNAISNAKVWHYVNTISRFSQHGVNSSTQLKALKTNGMLVGKVITYRDTSASNVLRVYELVAGTDAESLPSVVRPTDYATTTNEKVWKLAVLDSGSSVQAKVSVTSSEIKNINTTPKILIAAPGASKFIQLIGATMRYNYNSIAYASADNLVINHGNSGSAPLTAGMDITTITNSITKQVSVSDAEWNDALVVNAGLYLYRSAGNPTTGNGTLDIYLTYRIVDL